MPPPVLERALQLFPDTAFVNAYGLTETSSTITVLGPDDHPAARDGDRRPEDADRQGPAPTGPFDILAAVPRARQTGDRRRERVRRRHSERGRTHG